MLIPIAMIIMGFVYNRYPPYNSNVDPKAGYRSRRSMQSKESWDYAHRILARLYTRTAIVWGLVLYFAKRILPYDPGSMSLVFGAISVLLLLMPIPVTELLLKRKFGS
ncbi:MAG: SdpI family protein, partial [Oscillospiraceae bacterium]|jgi:uncharacterized membrane protein|nr:SdpI family protein [Oscillospiraceae bacterium]